jgi:hypothetical protein
LFTPFFAAHGTFALMMTPSCRERVSFPDEKLPKFQNYLSLWGRHPQNLHHAIFANFYPVYATFWKKSVFC